MDAAQGAGPVTSGVVTAALRRAPEGHPKSGAASATVDDRLAGRLGAAPVARRRLIFGIVTIGLFMGLVTLSWVPDRA